jgi:hypothetical protein
MRRTFTYVKESLRSILRSENGPSKVRKGDEEEEGGLEKHVLLSQDWKEKRKKFSLRCVWNENHIMERVRRRKTRIVKFYDLQTEPNVEELKIGLNQRRHGTARVGKSLLSLRRNLFSASGHTLHTDPRRTFLSIYFYFRFTIYRLAFTCLPRRALDDEMVFAAVDVVGGEE